MGGLVSQLLWRRRPDVVGGLVLCSTTRIFVPGRRERYVFGTLLSYGAASVRFSRMATRFYRAVRIAGAGSARSRATPTLHAAVGRGGAAPSRLAPGPRGRPMPRCRFDSGRWTASVDVPTAVVVTTKDRAIPADCAARVWPAAIDGTPTVFESRRRPHGVRPPRVSRPCSSPRAKTSPPGHRGRVSLGRTSPARSLISSTTRVVASNSTTSRSRMALRTSSRNWPRSSLVVVVRPGRGCRRAAERSEKSGFASDSGLWIRCCSWY